MKRIDNEEFTKMWLNAEITPKEIADRFGYTVGNVHKKRVTLGLAPKGTKGFGLAQNMKRKGERNAQKILKLLKEQGGFYPLKLLRTKFGDSKLHGLICQKRIFVVHFNFGRGTGANNMRNKHDLIFNEPYIYYSYACNSRTAIIRLMAQALKKPDTEHLQKTVTSFLRAYLTDAERFAVMWKLGIRKWQRSQVKSSIQIDGIIKPINRCPHYGGAMP